MDERKPNARRFNSLSDFLNSQPLTVDATLCDGWGARFPVKGIEIEASILFADISGFSSRTADLNPIETLIFVNHCITWMSAEGLKARTGIVDKYIGDEVMVVFAREFGSEDPFAEAVASAAAMAEYDAWSFEPHFGIASGTVIAAYTGSPLAYHASVFGAPVALAARCAACKLKDEGANYVITFPEALWGNRQLNNVITPRVNKSVDGTRSEEEQLWELGDPKIYEPKNMNPITVRQVAKKAGWFPSVSAEEKARQDYKELLRLGAVRRGTSSPPPESTV